MLSSLTNRTNKLKLNKPPNKRNSIIFASVFALIGVIALVSSFAATSSDTKVVEAESSVLSGSIARQSDTGASAGEYLEFGLEQPGWFGYTKPGPTNTGPTDESILTNVTNSQIESMMTEGAVIENVRISGGMITPAGNNVTLRNFILDASGSRYGFVFPNGSTVGNLTIEDGEIFNMTSAAILGMDFTARRLNIHDSSGDGIKAQNAGGSIGPVLVESSWIHRLGKGEGAHADGDQSRSGPAPIVFRGNNCDMPVNEKGGPGAPYKSNACFILHQAEGSIVSFIAEYNWLNGGNYTVYCDGAEFFRFNRIGRQYRYGVKTGNCGAWENNVWDDTDEPAP